MPKIYLFFKNAGSLLFYFSIFNQVIHFSELYVPYIQRSSGNTGVQIWHIKRII